MEEEGTLSYEMREATKRKIDRMRKKKGKPIPRQVFSMKGWENNFQECEIRTVEENKKWADKNIKSWIDSNIIPIQTECSICGKLINFRGGNMKLAIHFDHRHEGNEPIGDRPTSWLRDHEATEENIKKWKESDFGKLCISCNHLLPTKGRKEFLMKAVGYVFGNAAMEHLKSIV